MRRSPECPSGFRKSPLRIRKLPPTAPARFSGTVTIDVEIPAPDYVLPDGFDLVYSGRSVTSGRRHPVTCVRRDGPHFGIRLHPADEDSRQGQDPHRGLVVVVRSLS